MASFERVKNGYRAHVCVQSKRKSKTFPTKREAVAWSLAQESSLSDADENQHTLADALIRYRDEVTPTKRGSAVPCSWHFSQGLTGRSTGEPTAPGFSVASEVIALAPG